MSNTRCHTMPVAGTPSALRQPVPGTVATLRNTYRVVSKRRPVQSGRTAAGRASRLSVRGTMFQERPVSDDQQRATDDAVGAGLQVSPGVKQLYRYPGMEATVVTTLLHRAQKGVSADIRAIDTELCYNIELSEPLTASESRTLVWLLRETFEPEMLTPSTQLEPAVPTQSVVEVGPRMSFSSAKSTNATSICASCGLSKVTRMEVSRRYLVDAGSPLSEEQLAAFAALVHDRMTEQVYREPLTSFAVDTEPTPVYTVPVMAEGRAALERINAEMGLAFDEQDLEYYTAMFTRMGRDPSNVELFDIAQSNSEHSRHWFFGGDIVIDGEKMPKSLFKIVKEPLEVNPGNSVIGFKDNSSAIRGFETQPVLPMTAGAPSPLMPQPRDWDILLTAETHNFPCAVAPYPGAETGAGGRIRDTHATGIGSIMLGASAGYCTGNLRMEGYTQPWEPQEFEYPQNLASPLQILIDASNGASDYGNKFGEPLILGYTRTFGMRLPNGERREWLKPIMFSAGIGQIDHRHLEKNDPEVGMLIVKIGGPAYRIGMGGGAASSVPSGSLSADLDFNAVQRGDAEMSQKLWRVVRACVEMGDKNPIESLHDQGAGGNCNVVKEIIYPLGAEIDVRSVKLGDETMSVLEIWGAEYQENDCLLIKPDKRDLLAAICERERCIMQVIGTISGSGRVVLVDRAAKEGEPNPAVDLDLEDVLGDMPKKTFHSTRQALATKPLAVPEGVTAQQALDLVLRLPAVCSKRFLTTKVDRHVTGLIAQQQCVGPLHIPVADCAVVAQAHTGLTGAATSIGEQPNKGLINPAAMARLALGEALTNLALAKVTKLADVKASVNWMYAAKMDGEGAAMYDAAEAMRDAMVELEIACDGGKDSLSMAAGAGGETVKAPGNFVVSAYVTVPDITVKASPDLKLPGSGRLVHVDLAGGRRRLGGSALAQALGQLGDDSPDVDPAMLKQAFNATQDLVAQGLISAGHDISDGGLATSVLEMAFAGNCGIDVSLPATPEEEGTGAMGALFAEELGWVLEVAPENEEQVLAAYAQAGVPASAIGSVSAGMGMSIKVDGLEVVGGTTPQLRDVWEATSFQLERRQAAEVCVAQEESSLATQTAPKWHLSFTPTWTPLEVLAAQDKPRVAVIREEGSNGDREMAAAVHAAGMEPWDITMSDLLNGRAALDSFRGIVFVGGFSYADVLDSAKGWAGTIRFNQRLWDQFQEFYRRPDTFSLGVCNGCQLMALLGWVPGDENAAAAASSSSAGQLPDTEQPRFIHNSSGRFESRWSTVKIEKSPALMLQGMEGSTLGIWVAHGEGRAHFPDSRVHEQVREQGLAPIRYCNAEGETTESYPFNPNGSPEGIAALCSGNGRHLAMMPHPERCYMMWQNPWYPQGLGLGEKDPGPWLKLFQNAREWCETYDSGSGSSS